MNDQKKDIEKSNIYVTCCPICGNYVKDYCCDTCNIQIVTDVAKVGYVVEMDFKNLI